MQAFSLEPGSGIPLKLQLKAHIRYQVMAGLLRPADQLPPLRDLAAGLGINLNTVVRAVGELEREGFLYSHQGKGVFVCDAFPGQGCGAALRSLLSGILGPARDWGISPEDMALAMLAHAQLARPPQAASHRLLVVGGSRLQLRRLQGELEAALPVVVESALPEELADKLRTSDFKVAACTLFHAADLRRLLPRAQIFTLAPEALQAAFAELSNAEPRTRVVIVSRDWVLAGRVRRSLELCGLEHLKLEIVAGESAAALTAGLAGAPYVLATSDCRDLVQTLLAGRPDVLLLTEPVEAPPEAVAGIRRALGPQLAEPRVQLRSAWV